MAPGYGINSIGYANDPYFMYALNSYNPNFMAAQQTQTTQTQTQAQNTQATNPSFQGGTQNLPKADYSEKSNAGTIIGGVTIAAGAAALIYAGRKGKLDGLKKFLGFGKEVAENATSGSTVKNILKKLGKEAQEYTIQKNGMSFVMKDGKPIKIITQDKKVINDATKVADWLSKNTAVKDAVEKLSIRGKLPKGVKLSYTKEITDGTKVYKLTVENGKVVKAASKNSKGNFVDVAEEQFESFVKNHAKQVKEAETLSRTFSGQKIKLLNKKGVLCESSAGNLKVDVRNGEVLSATFNGRSLKPEEIKALQKDLKTQITNIGKEDASKYGLKDYEYVYRHKGGQVVRFKNPKNPKSIRTVEENVLTSTCDINNFLDKNTTIKTELENVLSKETLSEGYRIANVLLKSESGNIYTVCNNKIVGIKLADGTELKNASAIKKWIKNAENNNEYNKILEKFSD